MPPTQLRSIPAAGRNGARCPVPSCCEDVLIWIKARTCAACVKTLGRFGRSDHEYIATRSGRAGLPAFLLQELAADSVSQGLEWSLCLAEQSRPVAADPAHTAGQEPLQQSPLLNGACRGQLWGPALSRLDAGEWLKLGSRRSRGAGKSIHQAGKIPSRHTDRNSGYREGANSQGLVRSRYEWPQALAGPA